MWTVSLNINNIIIVQYKVTSLIFYRKEKENKEKEEKGSVFHDTTSHFSIQNIINCNRRSDGCPIIISMANEVLYQWYFQGIQSFMI